MVIPQVFPFFPPDLLQVFTKLLLSLTLLLKIGTTLPWSQSLLIFLHSTYHNLIHYTFYLCACPLLNRMKAPQTENFVLLCSLLFSEPYIIAWNVTDTQQVFLEFTA